MNTMLPMVNMAIMDESPLTRLGIEQFVLALRPNMRCTLQAASVMNLHETLEDNPLDLLISELAGEQETEQQGGKALILLCLNRPDIRQIIYTYSHCGELLSSLNHFPQVSLISRQESQEQAREYFLLALLGEKVCSPLIQYAIAEYSRGTELISQKLTSREYEVLTYLFRGLSLTETAARLHRSIKTVSAHKRNAMHKLGVNNDAGLFSLRQFF